MSRDVNRAIVVFAVASLVLSLAVVWTVADVRQTQALQAKTSKLVADQVTARQAPGDYDGDGIADAADACPTRPETTNGFLDGDGCPDVVSTTGAS